MCKTKFKFVGIDLLRRPNRSQTYGANGAPKMFPNKMALTIPLKYQVNVASEMTIAPLELLLLACCWYCLSNNDSLIYARKLVEAVFVQVIEYAN